MMLFLYKPFLLLLLIPVLTILLDIQNDSYHRYEDQSGIERINISTYES